MKLVDLNPHWVGHGGEGISNADGSPVPRREGVGIMFDCPCGKAGDVVYVDLDPPLDGGEPVQGSRRAWKREGNSFETLTLKPSIQKLDGCKWHGFVTNGEIRTC